MTTSGNGSAPETNIGSRSYTLPVHFSALEMRLLRRGKGAALTRVGGSSTVEYNEVIVVISAALFAGIWFGLLIACGAILYGAR